MIVVRLIGGLGNQMFEYAMAKALAERHNANLKLDMSWIRAFEHEKQIEGVYGLQNFKIEEEFATENETREYLGANRFCRSLRLRMNRYMPHRYKRILEEKQFTYDKNVDNCNSNLYIYSGYWQSYRYFESVSNLIKKTFSFKNEVHALNRKIADQILNCEAVSIHVRRGDYVNNLALQGIYGAFGLEYYYKSVLYMQKHLKHPVFFIFSDDIEWVRKNLKIDSAEMVFVDANKELTVTEYGYRTKGHEDLQLMMLCKHNIIANSSFSWWGAWLNKNPQKMVVAPRRWFLTSALDTKDLLPGSWIKI